MNRGLSAGPPVDAPNVYRDRDRYWVLRAGQGMDRLDAEEMVLPSDQEIRDLCRLAFHDGTCPEGEECRARDLHSQANVYYLQWSSIADAMIRRLGAGG